MGKGNNMAELETPITTQEQFDEAVKERLDRQEKKIRGEYADYEETKKKVETLETDLDEAQGKVKEHESTIETLKTENEGFKTKEAKTKAAMNAGLPVEFADRIQGTNDEEYKKDAEELAKCFKSKENVAPIANLGNNLEGGDSSTRESLRKMLKNSKGDN